MSADNVSRWMFERVNPKASGASGKISDLFRNEGIEARGHLTADAPPPAATLMAREVIQNSWDAAEELRRGRSDIPSFAIDFDFRTLSREEKRDLVASLGLDELARHAEEVASTPEDRKKLGLGTNDCLLDLDQRDDLVICEIIEHGATGMYGPWTGADSRMYLAMLSVGYNQKADGSGGTFGYGKAGLIRASHPRIVLAYSCFLERDDDPGVTRRLLGVTYWGQHKHNAIDLTGFARFGLNVSADEVKPFENEAADEVATRLGLEVRDPAVPGQLGTTFLVVDPSVDPDELRVAVERNWWPALLDERFNVIIQPSADGGSGACRPRKNELLADFVEAYDHLLSGADPADGRVARQWSLGSYTPPGGEEYQLGKLALIADPRGWSFPDEIGNDDSGSQSRSLVALTRDPRMVVEFHLPGRDISRRVPYVRGVFVASPEVNALLSRTEPKAHDKWGAAEEDDVDPNATRIAARILEDIKRRVKEFQDELRPPIDQTGTVRLQRLDEKLKKLGNQEGTKPPPPPRGDRPFSVRLDVRRDLAGDQLVLSGSIDVGLAAGTIATEVPSRIRIAFALEEDGRRGDSVPLHVTLPAGFNPVAGDDSRFDGTVTGDGVKFEIVSDPYRNDWTGELLVSGDVRDAETPEENA